MMVRYGAIECDLKCKLLNVIKYIALSNILYQHKMTVSV